MSGAIGIFDSGVGGIGVLARAERELPGERFIYYADTRRFPYGDAAPQTVLEGVTQAAEQMAEQGIQMLVLACNTATAVAAAALRARFDFPVLGIEPAIKPAITHCRGRRIAVIATALTLREPKFQRLFEQFRSEGELLILPAPGLADLVERGDYDTATAEHTITELFLGAGHVDGIVLGCTHYLFLLPVIERLYPDAAIFDGGAGLVRNLRRTLAEKGPAGGEPAPVQVLCSGERAEFLPRFARAHRDIAVILADGAHKIL